MTRVEFGIFDHVDRGEAPLAALYADRLAFVEAADAAGFRTYHVAFLYGTLTREQALRSLGLFAREVMPHFTKG